MLLELGEDLAIVQEVLGHADVRSTRGYQKVRTEATKRAAKRMGGKLFPAVLSLILSLSVRSAVPGDRETARSDVL